ncbi:MAG: hypothetical protein P8Z79_25000, partial [Sedimentisphaerales bacterium]
MHITAKRYTFLLALLLVSIMGCGVNKNTTFHVNKVSPRSDLNINSASKFVVVDQSEPAFTVFTGIPK